MVRAHLFQYIQNPCFAGLIARVGKRPVGMVLGHVSFRPYGRPSRYSSIYSLWVDPNFRKQGIGKGLWDDYTSRLKKAGIFHWEGLVSEEFSKELIKEGSVSKLQSVIGGKL